VTARLELGTDILALDASEGLYVRELDLGYPEVREVVDPRAGFNGTYDRTEFFGARVVSIDLVAEGAVRAQLDKLSRFTRPGTRPFLYVNLDGQQRRILLRASARSAPLVAPSNVLEAQVQWIAPDGIIEAANATVAVAQATSGVEDGRQYDLTFDRTYAPTNPVGTVECINAGTVAAQPTLYLFGPCTNPKIENLSTGNQLAFSTTLTASQFLEVNVRDRTVYLNGITAQNRYDTLDFTTSRWWALEPGINLVRYQPGTIAGAAFARIEFRSAWI